MNNGTIVNVGHDPNAFVQAGGNDLFTGTNGIYFTDWLQSQGVVTIDTSSIAEFAGNAWFDGIFSADGTGNSINLGGGSMAANPAGLIVNIATVEGPP